VHFTGPVEVSPRGLKGSFSDIPSDALYVAHRAATRAADEVAGLDQEVTPPMREIVADHAAFEAISALSLLQELAQFVDDERIIGLLSAATMNSETEAVARQLRDQIIAEAQFELSYGRRFTRREEALIKRLARAPSRSVTPPTPSSDSSSVEEASSDSPQPLGLSGPDKSPEEQR
jgi:hypothetical protein